MLFTIFCNLKQKVCIPDSVCHIQIGDCPFASYLIVWNETIEKEKWQIYEILNN
jgi:hypothetical protein